MKTRRMVLLRLLCLAVAVATINGVFAQHVSRETARSVAETFFNHNVKSGQGQAVHFEDITAETPFQNFYIFSADSGFVLVAADERVTPILGYSKTNRFVTEDMPENLRWWLEGYDGQIQTFKDNAVPATAEIATKWSCLKAGEAEPTKGNRSVELPLTTKWDQGAPYNNSCPITSGRTCVTGCTATALAQVFKYWNFPTQGLGSKTLNANQTTGTALHPECYPIYVDFSATTYDWQNMDDVLTSSSPQEKIDAVATLMKHCGVAMNMNYGTSNEGGSNSPYYADTICKYFDYSSCVSYCRQVYYSDDEWIAMLKNEINHSRPVLYRGTDDDGEGGHAFVFYGYSNDKFQVNWGWGGSSDGLYEIGRLNPTIIGIGGMNGKYNLNNAAVLYLIPNNRALSAPNNVEINYSEGVMHLSWSAVSGADSYIVLRNGSYLTQIEQNYYDDTKEIYAGNFHYQIISVGASGSNMLPSASLPSATFSYSIPFETPVCINLSAIASENSVNLSWVAPSNAITPIFHHQHPFNANNIKHTSSFPNNEEPYVREEFTLDEISSSIGKYITEIDVWVSTNHSIWGEYYAVGKQHRVAIVSGNDSYIASFTPTSADTKQLILENPIKIHNGIRVDLQVEGAEDKKVFDYLEGSDDLVTAYYYDENGILTQLGAGKHFIMYLYAKWANDLTYNVYRNDGHYLTCIARDLQQPNFTDANVPPGVYTYYVTTNYYGGESEPSEMVSVGCGDFTVAATGNPLAGGTVTGNQGSYPAGSTVTLTATAALGYDFSGWMENGVMVCNSPVYTFQLLANRHLTATFVSSAYAIGSLVTNSDGSQGVVFRLSQDGTEGWMVALNDASDGCEWGPATDITALRNIPFNDFNALQDLEGYLNTGAIRSEQGVDNEYAASLVDYASGWYLPSSGEMRKLYAALPFIEETITAAGGTIMTEDAYWSSTEFSATDAFMPSFAMSNTNKTSTRRVRAIRQFVVAGNNVILVSSNNSSLGTAYVSGNGTFTQGQTVNVTAVPESSCAFEYWSENGAVVSYDDVYQFSFTHTRSLEAHFSVSGSVGSIICNADGSKGVSFWLSPDGTEGLMVALEDSSDSCSWGPTEKVYSLVSCPFNDFMALKDNSGARNTRGIRNYQGTENEYATTNVDFANGWYLPSAGELRKLYAALPMIEEPLAIAGGCTLTEDNYWSSTEYSSTDALVPSFGMNNTSKGGTCRVRAIRSFAAAGPNCVTAKPNNVSMGTISVSGSGEFAVGQSVTVTAYPEVGYVFDSWTEAGMTVSYNPTYEFNFTRSRALTANFMVPGSIGSTVVNADGSKGVVFYTDPSGVSGWQVVLTDDSEGCPWGYSGEDVLVMDNLNPDPVYDLLSELDGTRNSRIMRGWFVGESGYAANQVEYNHQWFLPTAGQLRKLYAALPMIETAIINAGGTLLTDDAYWSSTEQSADNAWTPSFAFGVSNKGENHRVRAIRHFYTANIQNPHIFVGTNGILWSDPSNWINPSRNLLNNNDDVIVTTQCLVDEDATVKSLTMTYGSTINVDEAKTLAVTESISNTYDTRINLGNGSQLVNPTEGTYFSMNKTITGYGESEDGGWYTVATPLKSGMSVTHWTTGSYDLYYYDEPTYYWINQKDGNNNFTLLENGHGYLYSNAANQTMNFTGQAKSSISEYSMSFINTLASSPINGFNLLGNPFTCNLDINNVKINGATLSSYYKICNGNAWMAYTDADNEPIRPAEGFLVKGDAGTVSFNAASRMDVVNGYVRLVLYEGDQKQDRTYLRITDGQALPKMRMNDVEAELYFREGSEDFAIAESREDVTEYLLCLKARHNGTYTIVADLLNTESNYLHLIDNITGEDIDLLATPTYTFEAKAIDDSSRFKLVVRANSSYK